MLGALAGEVLSIPRILFAGARDGIMPKILDNVHTRFHTPHIAIALYALAGFTLSVFGGFRQLAIISTASALTVYLGAILAAIKSKLTKAGPPEKAFRMAGGLTIPLVAAAGIAWLLTSLNAKEFIGLVIFLALFSLIYWIVFTVKESNPLNDFPAKK